MSQTNVRALSTENIPTLSGTITIDGVSILAAQSVALSGQTDPALNGLWIVGAGAWTRHPDWSLPAHFYPGRLIYVELGTEYEGWLWRHHDSGDPPVVGTDSILLEPVARRQGVDAGRGLDVDKNGILSTENTGVVERGYSYPIGLNLLADGRVAGVTEGAPSAAHLQKPDVRLITNDEIALTGLTNPVDSRALVSGDRICVAFQSDTALNGVYLASATDWTRAPEWDSSADFAPGSWFFVTDGGQRANRIYRLAGGALTLGTDPINITDLTGTADAGGLVKTPDGYAIEPGLLAAINPAGATEDLAGIVELADGAEASAATANNRAMSPVRTALYVDERAQNLTSRALVTSGSYNPLRKVRLTGAVNPQELAFESDISPLGSTEYLYFARRFTTNGGPIRIKTVRIKGSSASVEHRVSVWRIVGQSRILLGRYSAVSPAGGGDFLVDVSPGLFVYPGEQVEVGVGYPALANASYANDALTTGTVSWASTTAQAIIGTGVRGVDQDGVVGVELNANVSGRLVVLLDDLYSEQAVTGSLPAANMDAASDTERGAIQVATVAEANALTSTTKALTPGRIPTATDTQQGVVELATAAELVAGKTGNLVPTAADLKAELDSRAGNIVAADSIAGTATPGFWPFGVWEMIVQTAAGYPVIPGTVLSIRSLGARTWQYFYQGNSLNYWYRYYHTGNFAWSDWIPGHSDVWTAPALRNLWVNFGAPAQVAGYSLSHGEVRLRGDLKNGTMTAGTTVLTLPVGFRPASARTFPTISGGNAASRIQVGANGDISIFGVTDNARLSLDSIRFEV